MQWISMNINKWARFSENQSAPKLENRKTSPCSPRAPNLLHVLPSRMVGWNELCNPAALKIRSHVRRIKIDSHINICFFLRVLCSKLTSNFLKVAIEAIEDSFFLRVHWELSELCSNSLRSKRIHVEPRSNPPTSQSLSARRSHRTFHNL